MIQPALGKLVSWNRLNSALCIFFAWVEHEAGAASKWNKCEFLDGKNCHKNPTSNCIFTYIFFK